MTGASVVGLGVHRPARVMTNDELPPCLDTDDAWIRRRTGIGSRRIATVDESVEAMAADAAGKALADAGRSGNQVDLVVLATCSGATTIPGGAAGVAAGIGAARSGAFDLNAACAGFCYALAVGADAVRSGSASTVVVAASERMSDVVDWQDRNSAILFGDGAGAAVITASDHDGVGPVVWGSDGRRSGLIRRPPGGTLCLDGPAVFRWAVTSMAEVAREACRRAQISPTQLKGFVPHQANGRIVQALARDLAITGAVADDVSESANTSAASIPLALARLRESGEITTGDPVLMLGFGAGLTWAGQVVAAP